ncbi:SDR family NAD(P)-dependent oxidoreductase [Phenylobacterium sp. LjRoot219]|uniref:SDR family NAD(P)-dependent oxidoreductase n=1 Tax=Phenylobacterium sp. LjRoot219 TaxID=3342283 RepID=UPI003ECD5D59
MGDLSGKRALVTGASRGVGFGIAKAFAAAGAEVVATARNTHALEDLQQQIQADGGRVTILAGDLATREGARDVARRSGEIDLLVNNAALVTGAQHSLLVEDDAAWDLEFAVNLIAPVTLIQALVPGMAARGGGVVINISSIAVQRPNPMHAAYAASKAALEVVTRAAAIDLGPKGVRLNAVALGMTATEAWDDLLPTGVTLEQMGRRVAPIGRATTVGEVAALCLYLASDAAAAITGTVLTIDGGATAGVYTPA